MFKTKKKKKKSPHLVRAVPFCYSLTLLQRNSWNTCSSRAFTIKLGPL